MKKSHIWYYPHSIFFFGMNVFEHFEPLCNNKQASPLFACQAVSLVSHFVSFAGSATHHTHPYTPTHTHSYSYTLLAHTTQQEFPSSVSQHGRASSSSSSLSSATFLISSSTSHTVSTLQHNLYITYTFLLTLFSVICILAFICLADFIIYLNK